MFVTNVFVIIIIYMELNNSMCSGINRSVSVSPIHLVIGI